MPSNMEIKAKVANFVKFLNCAKEISGAHGEVIHQVDTFFNCINGRLKLRCLQDKKAQLIFYRRPDEVGPKLSNFVYTDVENADGLKNTLTMALGVKGEVRKTRVLFNVGQTRIHADDVEGLGTFMELEVQMKDGQSIDEGQKIAEDLMDRLGVMKTDLITGAYLDHILRRKAEDGSNSRE